LYRVLIYNAGKWRKNHVFFKLKKEALLFAETTMKNWISAEKYKIEKMKEKKDEKTRTRYLRITRPGGIYYVKVEAKP
jgi:hypothetical protein